MFRTIGEDSLSSHREGPGHSPCRTSRNLELRMSDQWGTRDDLCANPPSRLWQRGIKGNLHVSLCTLQVWEVAVSEYIS